MSKRLSAKQLEKLEKMAEEVRKMGVKQLEKLPDAKFKFAKSAFASLKPVVRVEISGGVATLVKKPAGVIVIIKDWDNPSLEKWDLNDIV
jgi:hypothetical protein